LEILSILRRISKDSWRSDTRAKWHAILNRITMGCKLMSYAIIQYKRRDIIWFLIIMRTSATQLSILNTAAKNLHLIESTVYGIGLKDTGL